MVIILADPKNGARLGTWDLSLNSTICPSLTRMPLCIKTRDVFTNILLSLKLIDAIDSILFSCFMDKLNGRIRLVEKHSSRSVFEKYPVRKVCG
jgi:hypothetical protein